MIGLLIPPGGAARFSIGNSLRFRAGNSAQLSRAFGTVANNRTLTWSGWVKRGQLGVASNLLTTNRSFTTSFGFTSSDQFAVNTGDGGTGGGVGAFTWTSNRVFRDPTAWLHLVVAWDTTQAAATNRLRVWINGAESASWAAQATITQNMLLGFDGATVLAPANGFDGYLAECTVVDQQQLTASSFGQTDPVTGAWVPRRYTGSYGPSGFRLPFNDATSTTTISQDRSGNNNHWTSSGISVTAGTSFDQMLDTPTNNHCTWSFIDRELGISPVEGNLRIDSGGQVASHRMIRGTQFVSSGKFYFEIISGAGTAASGNVNVLGMDGGGSVASSVGVGPVQGFGFGYATDAGSFYGNSWSGSGSPPVMANTTYGIAVDLDAGRAWIRNAGGWFQGDPATNTNPTFTRTGAQVPLAPAWSYYNAPNPTTVYLNCGQRAFTYAPPTGFVAINTRNIPTPTIPRGDDAFFAGLRTGMGASASRTDLRFQPGKVWIKERTGSRDHNLFDAVRGTNRRLVSSSSAAETNPTDTLTAFNANGFSFGADASLNGVNVNTGSYVDWAWRRGAAYGFDIVTYTGNGTNRAIAHGLNAVPQMMTVKRRNTTGGWTVYHRNANASPQNGYLGLNDTVAFTTAATVWNNTAPTSGVFSVGTDAGVNGNLDTFVNYLWTSIPGFSLFGSYTGNGSTDGPFVWCGFRPRFVMIKRVDSTGFWLIHDAAREGANPVNDLLQAESSAGESVNGGYDLDFTANGFKVRSTAAAVNASGGTHIFAAFAEAPFKFATAR